jgi:hypothetical protein
MAHVHVAQLELAHTLACGLQQGLDALEGIDLVNQAGEHRGLVTGAAADLEDFLRLPSLDEQLGHPRHDVGLGQGLLVTDGQRDILVGAVRHGFVQKQVPGNPAHRIEHRHVADALLHQPLHQPLAGALRGHTDTVQISGAAHRDSSSTTACTATPSPRPM